MKKKKLKKKKKGKPLNYKLFVIIGGIFHFIVYLLLDLTFYNNTLFWLSLLIGGITLGISFIHKMELLNPKSYKKIKGNKLNFYILLVCFLTILGTTVIFGNVINGTILGLNYIGKNNETQKTEYKIEKIVQRKTGGRKRIRRNNPKVYLEKEGEIIKKNLTEHYSLTKNYSEYKKIEFITSKGLLGFEITENYELKK
tara:strand:+ start:1133 stop:1726 length:594 start_codon:yes stop_codon:yes gene_type:complete